MNKLAFVAPILLSMFLACGRASGAESVYEGFADYVSDADVLSVEGGFGFTGLWQGRSTLLGNGSGVSVDSLSLMPSSLSYADGQGNALVTAGGSLLITGENGSANMVRTLDLSALPNNGPDPQTGVTTYLSFLARRSGAAADPDDPVYGGSYPFGDNLYPRVAGVSLYSNDNGDSVPVLVGGPSNAPTDAWRLRGQDLDGVNKDPLIDQPFGEGNLTYLVVLRIDHGDGDGGADQINMYLNPLLADESLNTIGVTADWEQRDDPLYLPGNWIGIEAGDASGNRPHAEFTFDELRIGQTWSDVLPHRVVPEPASVALALLAATFLPRWRA